VLVHGICLYLSLNLTVSYSMFSIKTAAPLWFIYGWVAAQAPRRPSPARPTERHLVP
jgi:hypothetical protein